MEREWDGKNEQTLRDRKKTAWIHILSQIKIFLNHLTVPTIQNISISYDRMF